MRHVWAMFINCACGYGMGGGLTSACELLFTTCSGDLSVQVFVEMPFEIKSIESPSHKIKMKVSKIFLSSLIP